MSLTSTYVAGCAGRLAPAQTLMSSLLLFLGTCLAPAHSRAQNYTFQNVRIVGGGYVPGIIAHPAQQGLFYARTDVGGAYRYNSSTSTWVPLLDWTTPANGYQMGADSIAIDANNTNMLYITVGMYASTSSSIRQENPPSSGWDGNGAVLISSNQGANFSTVNMPFQMGSNDQGRNGGERLQVDPNLGNILYYGSYADGLWKSTNGGWGWGQVTSLPVTSGTNGAGIIFVAFDKASGSGGSATPIIFVGVSQSNGTALYESTNAGSTWSTVSGQPTGLFVNHGLIGIDGNFYLTYGSPEGPNSMTSGAVWRFNIARGTWTNITPPNGVPFDGYNATYNYGYSGLTLDPEASGTLEVTSMDFYWPYGDNMWRSTNGGSSWTTVGYTVNGTSNYSSNHTNSLAPWNGASFGNWPSGVVTDPFNSAHMMYGWAGGVWTTSNMTNSSGPSWVNGALGIEESVALQLISPTSGAVLVSAIGDICGFTHTSLTTAPASRNMVPALGTCTSVDWAKSNPNDLVRVGEGASTYGGYSTNQGSSWTAFGSSAGSSEGGGTVAISADGTTIIWSPQDVSPSYTTSCGTNWTSLSSYLPQGVAVLSDGSNTNYFYAYNPSTGTFYASSNKGVSWYTASTGLPSGGRTPYAVTGVAGDIWMPTGSGLYHSTNYGASWSQLGTVASAVAVSTGKAASGASYQTLYLSGTINGVTGVYRSINEGTTWIQINNTANQWGGVGVLAGDPRTFGTVYLGGNARGIMVGTSPN